MTMRRILIGAAAAWWCGLSGCVVLTLPTGEPTARAPDEGGARATLIDDAGFEVWDMHGSGLVPGRSEKVIDGALARRGYWFSSSALGMPKGFAGDNNGSGVPLAETDLADRERLLRRNIADSGIAGTDAMVMLDAEAFKPYDSEKALAWFNQTARIASENFSNRFWYFQPYRYESAKGFESEEAYYEWYAQQEFIRLASAISVTVYHGRDQDAGNPLAAKSRISNDRNLKRAIAFAQRVGKPLIVTVRADLSGRPRQRIMSSKALEASWGGLFTREGVDGIAIWNNQPADKVDFDRQWARTRIEPVLRKLLEERAAWREEQ
jgi:hypothetical protein